ncbi:hypothetical protein [Lapillicoccus sp.]|uniref:type II secretion system F family protein n=1 Tax=Lapillicoccus sp. TaxID=1909287 RepID=UPI0025F06B92|nr:hypothetical protein [Lapillicoccus sp.]
MMVLAAVLLALAVVAWPPRDRSWSTTGARAANAPGTGIATGGRFLAVVAHDRPWGREGRDHRDGAELVALLDAIAPALAAGLPPAAALAHLSRRGQGDVGTGGPRSGPVDALLADLVAEATAGRPLAPVWTRHALEGRWGRSGPSGPSGPSGSRGLGGSGGSGGSGPSRSGWSGEVAFVARAWSLSESLGSPLAECATVAARVVRQQSARRQRLAIALAGPRATAAVLTALPLAGPVVGLLLGLSPRQLYATPAALASTLSGLVLLMLGRWWCSRLVAGIGGGHAARRPRSGGPAGVGRR